MKDDSTGSSTLRIGIIGGGRQAQNIHIPCLNRCENVQITALCDVKPQNLRAVGERLGVDELYSDYQAMLCQASIDAVYVVTNPPYIFEIARAALETRIPTFLEKPPGMNSAETAQLLEVAERKACIAMVGFNRRFSPLLNDIKRTVENEGPIATVISEFHTFNLAHYGNIDADDPVLENFITAQTIHHVDLVRYLCGEMDEVHSLVGQYGSRYDDNFAALMRSDSGTIVNLVTNYTTETRLERVSIFGNKIAAWVEGPEPRDLGLAYAFTSAKIATETAITTVTNAKNDDLYNSGFLGENEYFVDWVKTGNRPNGSPADLHDAVQTMRLVETIAKGGRTGHH